MVEGLKIGDYGRFKFTMKKEWMTESKGINLIARVIETNDNHVTLKDNDDFEYHPKKKDIIKFRRRHEREDILENLHNSVSAVTDGGLSDLKKEQI